MTHILLCVCRSPRIGLGIELGYVTGGQHADNYSVQIAIIES